MKIIHQFNVEVDKKELEILKKAQKILENMDNENDCVDCDECPRDLEDTWEDYTNSTYNAKEDLKKIINFFDEKKNNYVKIID